jgi:hypothetical protein
MRLTRKALLAGLASFALAGAAAAAGPGGHHVLNVALPDGAIAQIQYVGDTPPTLLVDRGPPAGWLAGFDGFDAAPFAMLDRIAADMDRQFATLFHQIDLAAAPSAAGGVPGLNLAAASSLPAGTMSYSFVSTSDGSGTCSRTTRVTSLGTGQAPKVESQVSGDCASAAAPAARVPAAQQAVAPAPDPKAARPTTRT